MRQEIDKKMHKTVTRQKVISGIESRSWTFWLYIVVWGLSLLIILLGLSRFSIAGQGIDDVFRFLFGWTKYVIYLLLLVLILWMHFKTRGDFWSFLTKRNYLKILWTVFNLYWTLGLIGAMIWNSQNGNIIGYADYGFSVISNFVKDWYSNSIFTYQKIVNVKDFFQYHNTFSRVVDGGGIVGIIIVSLTTYLSIFGAWSINLFSWFLVITYIVHNYPWFYFLSYEEKTRIRWKNLNENKKYRIQTNIIDEIEDQDMTIELQTARKMQIQDEEQNKTTTQEINSQHRQEAAERANEEVQSIKITIKQQDELDLEEEIKSQRNEQRPDWWKRANTEKTIVNNTKISTPTTTKNKPQLSLFKDLESGKIKMWFTQNQAKIDVIKINRLFNKYNVGAIVENTQIGISTTKYTVKCQTGVEVEKIWELEEELKSILPKTKLRLAMPIPEERQRVDIEITNQDMVGISCKEIVQAIKQEDSNLSLGLGKNTIGEVKQIQFNKLPHLLIASSFGEEKKIALLTMICSLLYQHSPETAKLLLIDSKKGELTIFNEVPHLIAPVITNVYLVAKTLDKILAEIDRRFDAFEEVNVVNIEEYNAKATETKKIPFIAVVINELADLILLDPNQIESKIVKIAQIGEATGICMLIATQQPSENIVTELIKSNIPGKIAFQVSSHNESQTILNHGGAEKLTGRGDMLYLKLGMEPQQIQGNWIEREEISNLVTFWKQQNYQDYFWKQFEEDEKKGEVYYSGEIQLYQEIKEYILTLKEVSISLIQERFSLDLAKATNIFKRLEAEKIIETGNPEKRVRRVIASKK